MMLPRLSDVPPELLTRIGASAMHGLDQHGYLSPRAPTQPRVTKERAERGKRSHTKSATPRLFRSRYVGVMQHRNRWISQWEIGDERFTSTVFPGTDEGERMAAEARQKALGLPEVEMRPPEQVRPQTPLGGKRVA